MANVTTWENLIYKLLTNDVFRIYNLYIYWLEVGDREVYLLYMAKHGGLLPY